jgi:hypothetical protein
MSQDSHQLRLTEPTDTQFAEYKSLSGWAVAGLIFGLLSPAALVVPMLWSVPLAGLIINSWALWKIKQNYPSLLGRKAAMLGAWLSLLFVVAGISDWFYYRWRIQAEAQQVALFWFDLLAKNRPELAFQLNLSSAVRQPLDARIWEFYKDSERWRTALKNFVAEGKPDQPPQLVRTLLALGDSAQVRYLSTLSQVRLDSDESLNQLYAVTFVQSGEKKTFLVNVQLLRSRLSNGHAFWQILGAQGGVGLDGKKTSSDGSSSGIPTHL